MLAPTCFQKGVGEELGEPVGESLEMESDEGLGGELGEELSDAVGPLVGK